jgi:hypothetical protein
LRFWRRFSFLARAMSYQPTWKERLDDARPYIGPVLATTIVVGVIAWVTWQKLTPTTAGGARPATMAGEVEVLEKTYERAFGSGVSDAELERLLDRAIQKQREALQSGGAADAAGTARLARLEATRGTLQARSARARSEAAEVAAQEAKKLGRREEAAEKFGAALRWEQQANASQPPGGAKDGQREARLAAAQAELEAEPLHQAVEVARTLATAALARGRWDEALKGFSEARARQVELNTRFPRSRYVDAGVVERFDTEIASLNAAGIATQSATREREGEQALPAGRTAEAGAAFEAAAALQREIEEKFPRSRFVAPQRLVELGARRDTALASADLKRAAELERDATQLLRARKPDTAGERLAEASMLLERVATAYPRAGGVDATLRLRVAYLAGARGELAGVHESVHARLLRLPTGTAQMLGVEVSQDLYAAVMRTNPSRHAGRGQPVDSVSWFDAREFCARLGWMLGGRVRLPTEAEFRAAFGRSTTDGATELAAGAWSAENAGGRTHDVGKSTRALTGCFDLAGNVAEWLEAGAGDSAPVAGGSYLDLPADLRRVPVASADKRERARHIGFRVMVEWPN